MDGQSIERFAAKAEDHLAELSAALRAGSDRPQAVKRVDIPMEERGRWAFRRSRIASSSKLSGSLIEPIFETRFRDGSYGFRTGTRIP